MPCETFNRNDNAWIECFEEAVRYLSGQRVVALTHDPCQDPPGLWDRFRTHRLEIFDTLPSIPFAEQDYGLHLIEEILLGMGRTLTEFRLPRPQHDWNRDDPLIRHELDYDPITELCI